MTKIRKTTAEAIVEFPGFSSPTPQLVKHPIWDFDSKSRKITGIKGTFATMSNGNLLRILIKLEF